MLAFAGPGNGIGCSAVGGAKDELNAARVALANDPEVEVVATDGRRAFSLCA